jgi:hypothetical protein
MIEENGQISDIRRARASVHPRVTGPKPALWESRCID